MLNRKCLMAEMLGLIWLIKLINTLLLEDSKCSIVLQQLLCFSIAVET